MAGGNSRKVLVLDVGGTNVKLMRSGSTRMEKVPTGSRFGPRDLVRCVAAAAEASPFDAIALGLPGVVRDGKLVEEPWNLGGRWAGFDFAAAFRRPTRVVNDAVLQAHAHAGKGRMLFLGLGTGFGSALAVGREVFALELCQLPHSAERVMEDVLGKRGYKRLGLTRWEKEVQRAIETLRRAFLADRVVIGGGNAKRLTEIPEGCEIGSNRDALRGGVALWRAVTRKAGGK
jgi:predicted NBD/HSP70 family sugar kinase